MDSEIDLISCLSIVIPSVFPKGKEVECKLREPRIYDRIETFIVKKEVIEIYLLKL